MWRRCFQLSEPADRSLYRKRWAGFNDTKLRSQTFARSYIPLSTFIAMRECTGTPEDDDLDAKCRVSESSS